MGSTLWRPVFTLLSTGDGLRPGLSLLIILVLLAAVVGAGVWWKIGYLRKVFSPRPHTVSETSNTARATDAPSPGEAPSVASAVEPPPESSPAGDPGKVGALPAVTGVRYWSSSESSTVVIDLEDQVQYEAHRLADPERIYLDLHDTELAFGLNGRSIDIEDPLLVRVRMAQPAAGITRVVLETRSNSSYSVSLEQNPYRLVVEVHKPGVKPRAAGTVDLFAPAAVRPSNSIANSNDQPASASSAPQRSKLATEAKIHLGPPPFRIVLDAGHGGWDLGTVGQHGLLEKDLVLDIVNRLGKLIEDRLGGEVIYTRQQDVYVPLEKRAEIANLSKADLFLSVHANYSDYVSARGVETYYTRTYSSLKARTAETIAAEAGREDAEWTKVDIRDKVQQSHRFAASVQSSLYGALVANNPGLRDRGVKQASYVVLTGASMPAILAEVSFVSSPADESELERSAYRQKIARALFQGLVRYEASAKRERLAVTASERLSPHQLSATR
jgi:N-acetylmuramoyl-L-alanine amidase